MAIANMGRNNYVRKPNPFEAQIINKLSRYFTNQEFVLDPAAPEAMILEVLNRVLPIIRTTARITAMQLAQGAYQPEDIQAILEGLKGLHKDNLRIIDRILALELALDELSKPDIETPADEPEPEPEDTEQLE